MADKEHGKNATIYFHGFDFTGQSNSWSVNPTASSAESNTYGDEWDSKSQGPPAWTAQVSGLAGHEGGAGGTKVSDKCFALLTAGDGPLLIYPKKPGATKPYWYGVGHVTGSPHSSERKGMNTFQLSIEGGEDGELQLLQTA